MNGGTVSSILSSSFVYLSPAKSPFYLICSAGAFSLILSCDDNFATPVVWNLVAVPIYVVLLIAVLLSFVSKHIFTDKEYEEHIRYGRSIAISGALLCFVIQGMYLAGYPLQFYVNYGASLAQVLIFLVYAYARHKKEEGSTTEFNFVQLSLITLIFLWSGAVSAELSIPNQDVNYGWESESAEATPQTNPWHFESEVVTSRAGIVAIGFYILWIMCIAKWVQHIRKLVNLQFVLKIPE